MTAASPTPSPTSEPDFVGRLLQQGHISETEFSVLREAGVRDADEMLALSWAFPGITQIGCELPKMSNVASRRASRQFVAAAAQSGASQGKPPQFARGAAYPQGAPGAPRFQVPAPPAVGRAGAAPAGAGAPPALPRIDLRLKQWPVKDQGQRGTCVAFALTACREHFAKMPDLVLSEQYLYWAVKANPSQNNPSDPAPNQDGTWIEYGRDALRSDGLCVNPLWRYNMFPIPGNISQATASDPSAPARQNAPTWSLQASSYQVWSRPSGAMAAVLAELQQGSPVAISLPVFVDSLNPTSDNWNTQLGIDYGRVLNPVPTSVSREGHAVCVTGFEPDATEPLGGWFIIRNSWGTTNWSRQSPAPPYLAPEAGYGQVSATYVDRYLWEMCRL